MPKPSSSGSSVLLQEDTSTTPFASARPMAYSRSGSKNKKPMARKTFPGKFQTWSHSSGRTFPAFHVPSPIAETNPLQQSCPFDTRGSARNWLPVHKMDAPQGRQNNSPWPTSHRVPPLRAAAPVSESSRTPENLSEPGHLSLQESARCGPKQGIDWIFPMDAQAIFIITHVDNSLLKNGIFPQNLDLFH